MIFDAISTVIGVASGVFDLFGPRGGGGTNVTNVINQAPQLLTPTSQIRPQPFAVGPGQVAVPAVPAVIERMFVGGDSGEVQDVVVRPAIPERLAMPGERVTFNTLLSGFVPDPEPVRVVAAPEPFALERQLTRGTALTPFPPKIPRGDLPMQNCTPCVPVCQAAPGRKRPSRRSDVERLQDALNRARRQLARANRCPPITIVLPGGTRRRIRR